MPIPPFVVDLRAKIGHDLLWMPGITAVVLRDPPAGGGAEHEQEVLLIKRSDTGAWTPVTGITDPGEHPHLTAEREVLEEARVVARVERLVWVSAGAPMVHQNGDHAQYLTHTFRCRWVSGEPTPDDDEASEAAWFPVGALPEMSQHSRERVDWAVANHPDVRLGD